MLNLDQVKVVGGPLVLATAAEVQALEARLWIEMPRGYLEYVTKLGEGVLGGTFVRIYPPWRIEPATTEWHHLINKYWFWDEGRDLLPRDRARECVVIGDTLNGDELVFHPRRLDRLFVLPRHSESIFDAGPDLLTAVEWLCGSGKLTRRFKKREFEPFDSRIPPEEVPGRPAKIVDPDGESLDEIMTLARRWAQRHDARTSALEGLKRYLRPGQSIKLVSEAINIECELNHHLGYSVTYSVIDDKSGREVGVFRGFVSEGSIGGSYAQSPLP